MGWYSDWLFPRILDKVMRDPEMSELREALLAGVQGEIFEIGFGTGLNLRYYPERVKEITTVDPNPGCNVIAERRISESQITVHNHKLSAEQLPMDDASFDTVVCTWTLCSIENVGKALDELHRVLRPGGKLLFVEHGLSNEPKVQKWQNRLNPIWKVIGDGCNLNRNPNELIRDHHFAMDELENLQLEKGPKFATYIYKGIASRA